MKYEFLYTKKYADIVDLNRNFENGQELNEEDIPAINLDTGRLINADSLDLIPELWK